MCLPRTGIWPVIRKNIETELERSEQCARTAASSIFAPAQPAWPPPATTPVTPHNPFGPVQHSTNPFLTTTSPHLAQFTQYPASLGVGTYTFKHAAQTIIKEAMQMTNEASTPGPGSEYASAALAGKHGEVNPVTNLRRTKNNPSGRKRVDHDWDNCFHPGGGKAGQAPWQRSKATPAVGTTPSATVAVATPSPPVQANSAQTTMTPLAAAVTPYPPTDSYFRDLSCAVVEELAGTEQADQGSSDLAALATATLSTILDSGTTTHLIKDSSLFWTFTRDSTVSMRTASHGSLSTEGAATWESMDMPPVTTLPVCTECRRQSFIGRSHG
ncbi:hypothetical protein EDD15DRAFT_2200566 [Pisolithus albus]|nr:hypothetical protein EDD15DRAFT_2200566 [Pisolithus albus]